MNRDELLNDLLLVIKQTNPIATLNPNSVDAIICKKCTKAYNMILETKCTNLINIKGISRQYADCYGYNAPLLMYISKIENALEKLK